MGTKEQKLCTHQLLHSFYAVTIFEHPCLPRKLRSHYWPPFRLIYGEPTFVAQRDSFITAPLLSLELLSKIIYPRLRVQQ